MLSFIRKHPLGVGAGATLAIAGLAWLAFGFFGVHTLFIDDVVEESGPVFDASPVALETDSPATTPPSSVTTDPQPAPVTTESATAGSDAAVASSDDSSDDAADSPAIDDDGADDPAADPADDPAAVESTPPTTAPTDVNAEPATPEIVTEYQGVFEGDAHPTAGNAVVLGNGTGQRFLRLEDFETDNGPDLNVYLVNSSTGDVSDYIDLGDLKGNIGDQNYEIPVGVDLDVYDEVVIWCVRFSVGFGDASLAPV